MNLILKTKFGSHLYGTDSPNSDLDFKGVYIAPMKDIVLNRVKETMFFNTKVSKGDGVRNTKDDTDFEVIELRKFIKDALDGQTYALDLLFTPLTFTEQYSWVWEFVHQHRDKFLSKNMEPYIGYCRHQAAKYGLKGSRLGDIIRVIDFLKQKNGDDFLGDVMEKFEQSEFVKIINHQVRVNSEWKNEKWWDIVGKKFAMNTRVKNIVTTLQGFMDKYGERARLAQKNEGVDWKAISHAYRCMYQLAEISKTGELIFPLKTADRLKKIKAGEISYQEIQDELPELINLVSRMVKDSTHLSDEPDKAFWEKFLLSVYIKS